MRGRPTLHLVVTLAVWTLVLGAFITMFTATALSPGLLLDPSVEGGVLGVAALLILPAALAFYFGKEEQHPELWRHALMGGLVAISWLAGGAESGTAPAFVPLLIEAAGLLATFGAWRYFERRAVEDYRGIPTDPSVLLRGTQVLDAREPPASVFRERSPRPGEVRPIRIGSARVPPEEECRSFLVAGAPGTGKSVAIGGMLETIRARGERAIVYDVTGEFLTVFHRSGDTILNPVDARGASWAPWADAPLGISDYERMAEALIPENREQPFWHQAGRALLASVLAEAGSMRSVEEGVRLIQSASDQELREVVDRHGLGGMVGSPQTFANVRAAMAVPTTSLRYLRDGERPFGLRDWARSGRGWLWLTSRADQHAVLKPLISLWVDLAVGGVMMLPPSQTRRVWLVLDELPSLQRLPALEPALAGGRKHGLVSVLGIQSVAQLRVSYGRDEAEALLGQPQTQLLLRLPDPETAQWASRAIGERHIVREVRGESHGTLAANGNGHQTTSWQHQIEAAVLPSQIQALPRLEGYLRIADLPEVRHIRLTPVSRPTVARAFVPRSGGGGAPVLPRSAPSLQAGPGGMGPSMAGVAGGHPDLPEIR